MFYFFAGMAVMFVLWWIANFSNHSYLLSKAKDRSSLCIRGKFFVLLPEKDYFDLRYQRDVQSKE